MTRTNEPAANEDLFVPDIYSTDAMDQGEHILLNESTDLTAICTCGEIITRPTEAETTLAWEIHTGWYGDDIPDDQSNVGK